MTKAQSIVGFGKDREENDFYPTPPIATQELLAKEKLEGTVWECASGDGAIAKFFPDCMASDRRTDDDVYGEKGIDFLNTYRYVNNIITNPPYRYARQFVEHALECADKKVVMLFKLVFLESSGRYEMFKSSPLKMVYVFCKRLKIYKKGVVGKNAGLIAYAWFVWDKSYYGKPMIDWII